MEGMLSGITSMLGPVASGKLGHALIGLVLLIVGLIIVKTAFINDAIG